MVQNGIFFRPKEYGGTSRGGKMGKHKAGVSSMDTPAFAT